MPDQRRSIGRRDAAILQVLGDAGLRSAELRGLRGDDLVRARRDSPRRSLRILRGKGGRGRTMRLTKAADEALDRWLAVHPLRLEVRGTAATVLPAAAPLFCTLGRGRHTGSFDIGRPLSVDALEGLVACHARRAGLPTAFGHPHVLRRYCLTRTADLGEPVHKLAAFAGHADIRVTQQYLAIGDPEAAEAIDRIDAHAAARARA
jgi:integrase